MTAKFDDPVVLGKWEVKLLEQDFYIAGRTAIARQVRGYMQEKNVGRYGINNMMEGMQRNWEGACGETAAHKCCNRYYNGGTDGIFTEKDMGPYQIRSTSDPDGCLILHPGDRDYDKFILVLSHRAPIFLLYGWLYGYEGKLKKYWTEKVKGRPAFFVQQAKPLPFHSMDTLEEEDDGSICSVHQGRQSSGTGENARSLESAGDGTHSH